MSNNIQWVNLTVDQQNDLIAIGNGEKDFFWHFFELANMGLCRLDKPSSRAIVTGKGREVLEQAASAVSAGEEVGS